MINVLSKAITNPTLVNIAQNTDASVTTKTVVNAIGRPGFILVDNNIDLETKKFAATKEFLYQGTSLLVYMALIVPLFKKGGFKFAKNYIFKNSEGFEHFKNFNEYMHYRKHAGITNVNNRLKTLDKDILNKNCKVEDMYNETLLAELRKDKPDQFNTVKGAVDLCNIIGSVVGLSLLAPNVSQALIRPVLKIFGMDRKPDNQNSNEQKIDTKA